MIISNYRKISSTVWQDTRNGKKFSHNQFSGTRFGKDHYYLSENTIEERLSTFRKNQDLSTYKYENVMDQLHIYHRDIKPVLSGKSVLIVGGGPTTNQVKWSNIDYDFSFTCNNFYKNEFLKNHRFDFVSLAPFMDLTEQNKELHAYLKENKPLVGIEPEHSKQNEIKQLQPFLEKYEDTSFIYQTKYCSAIGMSTRQVVLSALLGAAKVYMVGLDLFDDDTRTHAYEKSKEMPRWRVRYGKEFQERQVIIFWDYLNNLSSMTGCKFYNLSEGMDQNHMSFASREFSPLPYLLKKVSS